MVYPGRIFEHLHCEFFAALEACSVRPHPKPVHQLRTTTRRMEALLNTAKRRRHGNASLERKIDKALKALKPIRAAAGPVRDTDVQRKLLADLLNSAGAVKPSSEQCLLKEETRKLEAKLKQSRKDTATDLISAIKDSTNKRLKWLSPLQSDLYSLKWMHLLKDAHSIERRSSRRLDVADPESLHEYRKNTKFARYIAEMEEESAPAKQFAKKVKKVLDAIGRWHDWMLLTQLARETLGKSSKLAQVLKKKRDRSLRQVVLSVETLHRHA
jgi:CHAD domain-containing protein